MKIHVETPEQELNNSISTVEIYVDEDGLEFLKEALGGLKAPSDDLHLMAPSWGLQGLEEAPFYDDHTPINHVKITRIQ